MESFQNQIPSSDSSERSLKEFTAPNSSASPVKTKRFILGFSLGLLFAVLALTAYVYTRPFDNMAIRAAAQVLPYPAALVNGQLITIKDYLKEYDTLKKYFASQEQAPAPEELAQTALDTVINKKVLIQMAVRWGVVLDQEQVEEVMENIAAAPGGQEAFAAQLEENFGWTLADFREQVAQSLVLANQLTEYAGANADMQAQPRSQIEAARARLLDGEDFAAVAVELSQDVSAAQGGDIGVVNIGQMVEPWLSAIAVLEPGDFSEVVESPENFIIFQARNRIKKGEEEEFELSVIMVYKRTLDEFIQEFTDQSNIRRLARF